MEEVLRLLSTTKAFDRKWGLSRVSGPTRYFLARFLLTHGRTVIRHRQPDFVGDWLLTDRVVSSALSELTEERILRSEPEEGQTRGRPRTRRWLDASFVDDLGKQEPGPGSRQFGQLIEHILTSRFESGAGGRRTKLTPYNRLLLAVLIAHADSRGVVANLGITHVQRLAGHLSQDQLTSQMSRFAERGYLRGRVSGVSGKRMFGKATGLMYLNPGHPDFGSLGRPQWVVLGRLRDEPSWSADRLCSDARPLTLTEERIRRQPEVNKGSSQEVRRRDRERFRLRTEEFERQWTVERFGLSRPEGFQVPELGELHKFFMGGVSRDIEKLLQAHVNELASKMLASGQDINGFMGSWGEDEFAFLTDLLGTANENLPEPSRLASAVFVMAEHLRQDACRAIEDLIEEGQLDRENLESAEFVIPPVSDPFGGPYGLSVVIIPASRFGISSGGGWMLRAASDGSATFKAFEDEFELNEETRERFSLRGKSKRYPEKQQE